MNWMKWYDNLLKPSWTPSPSTIGLIWTLLYPIIIISFWFVFYQIYRNRFPKRVILPFVINAISNLLFMPLFSGLRNISLATLDITVIWMSLFCCIISVWKYSRMVAVLQFPYFLWVSIAMVIQISIMIRNV
jgi:translocator protein